MQRLALLILLLTVVYSWEESKYVLVAIWSKLTGRNQIYQKNPETDVLVSDIVLIATIPLTLAYLILVDSNLPTKLFVLLAEFVFLGLLLRGIQEYIWRRRFTRHYQGFDRMVAMVFSLTGLVSPTFNFASDVVRSGTRPAKYLMALVIPLASGLALALAVRYMGMDEFVSQLDLLIAIATLGLILNITIEILEKLFRIHHLSVGSLVRVSLGITIILILTSSI